MFKISLLVALASFSALLVYNFTQFNPIPFDTTKYDKVKSEKFAKTCHGNENPCTRFAKVLQFPTVTTDTEQIEKLLNYLRDAYPLVHKNLQKIPIPKHPLTSLYLWQGKNSKLKPALLMAHVDVVPVENATQWTYPPFSGEIHDGFIYGRGTLDVKIGVVGILEAVEALLESNYQPERSFYLAFGDDEEVTGYGAQATADYLQSQNVELAYVLDEGGWIASGMIDGLESDVILIATSEKGFLTTKLVVEADGGHSSQPPPESAIGILSKAIVALEQNQMSASITFLKQSMDYFGPYHPNKLLKFIMANANLLQQLLFPFLSKVPYLNSFIRTTTAPTIINAGVKENVLPMKAEAYVNFRISPLDNLEVVLQHMKRVINDDRVNIEVYRHVPPSTISCVKCQPFELIAVTALQLTPECIASPTLMTAATDSRYYRSISKHVYGFFPMRLTKTDLKRIHAVDERIAVSNFLEIVTFYHRLIQNTEVLQDE